MLFLHHFIQCDFYIFSFLSETNSYKNIIKNAHEVPFEMGLPLGILAFGSIFIGYLTKDMFVGLGSNFWNNSIYIDPFHNQIIDAEFLSTFIKLLPVILSFVGLFVSFYVYFLKFKFFFFLKISKKGLLLYNFLNRKWYFDKIYYEFINQYILQIGYNFTYKMVDKGLIEICGPYGLTTMFSFLSQRIILLQTGYIYHYSLLILISTIFLINIIFFSIIYYFNSIIILLFLFIFLLII